MKSKILIAAAATLLVSQTALAHAPCETAKHGALLLKKLDTNGDGQLSRAEIDAAQAKRFAKFDADGNGQLNLNEFQALWLDRRGDRIAARFHALDTDGDGTVSLSEMDAPVAKLVARADLNGDGVVTADELHAARRGHHRHHHR